MGRRKQSALIDVLEITSKVPWWVGVVLALVSFALLHWVASIPIATPADLNQFASSASKQIVKTVASLLQYVLPAIFLVGSAASALARRKRERLHARGATSSTELAAISWQDFELLVGEFFRRRGFSVKETGGGGADGGVDLILSTAKDRYVVQCKKWKAMQVDVRTVRELYGVMTAVGAAGAFVVTSGTFTPDAKKFAEGREIELIDAEYLLREIGSDQQRDREAHERSEAGDAVKCPTCGAAMTLRIARKGPNVGQKFWGCSSYPQCRGTRTIT